MAQEQAGVLYEFVSFIRAKRTGYARSTCGLFGYPLGFAFHLYK